MKKPCSLAARRSGSPPVITADMVRDLIVSQDAGRPRSQQKTLGPSNLSTPCARKIGYQVLDVPPVTPSTVNLAAWVGTGIHEQMELACAAENKRAKAKVWETEIRCQIPIKPPIQCHVDAYYHPTYTALDWKSVGPSALQKYRRQTPDNYATQIDLYGLALVLSGYRVDTVGICYIPRNGDLSDIHVTTWPWTGERADAAIKRYEQILAATGAGAAVLPLLPTAGDCRFCRWWNPGVAWTDPTGVTAGCPGHPETTANQAEEPNPTQPERNPT